MSWRQIDTQTAEEGFQLAEGLHARVEAEHHPQVSRYRHQL